MRIHQILEECVEYVAFDGAIGSDPTRLIAHLIKLDSTLDEDYFTHLWTLLCDHPSIQIIITNEPILLPGGTTELGTAPLPEGWIPPQGIQANVDISTLYKEGLRGRQIAFMLAGQEFRSDKQAIQDKKEAQRKKAKKAKEATLKRNKIKDKQNTDDEDGNNNQVKVDPSGEGILRVLHIDDSQEGDSSQPVPKKDLRRLWEKWGARLRIRCTEDEIYYRLTGSHAKINKITSTVFHVLQLAAMAREKGITAIDLGPLVGASQGSMHYFMKVLVQLGLCAKVPAVLHASITNLLIFHRFLDQNPNYQSLVGKPIKALGGEAEPESIEIDPEDEGDEQESGDEQVDPSLADTQHMTDMVFDFSPLTEANLMSGHIVKQRLLTMLEHPGLQNHLLRTKNLLPTLGWTGRTVMRHRRAVVRHIDSLVMDGSIERVFVGEAKTSCIRLTKYNPESATKDTGLIDLKEEEVPELTHDLELISSQPPYAPPLDPQILNIPLTATFERWIIDLVLQSERNSEEDQRGITINLIWRNTNHMYKRSIDFAILRSDNAHVPEHLWPSSISSFMETVKKERRLRLFTTAEFQRIMHREGQELEGYPAIPQPETAGDFGDNWFKDFFNSETQLNELLDSGSLLSGDAKAMRKLKAKTTAKAKQARTKQNKAKSRASSPAISVDDDQEGSDDDEDEEADSKAKKDTKYANDSVQVRGRPRKYVHVVEEDGKVNRRIIGTIFSREDLPQVLIYMKDQNLLVTASSGYSGIGPPPSPTEEDIKAGHPPEYYYQFPTKTPAVHSTRARAKLEAAAAATAKNGAQNVGEGGKSNKKSKGKKRAKGNNGSGSEAGNGTPSVERKAKKQKKDVSHKVTPNPSINQMDENIPQIVKAPPTGPAPDGSRVTNFTAVTNPEDHNMQNHDTPYVDDNDIDPALRLDPALKLPSTPNPAASVASLTTAHNLGPSEHVTTLPSVPSQAVETTSRSTRKRGKANKEQAEVKQEMTELPKGKRQPRKSKATEGNNTTTPTCTRTLQSEKNAQSQSGSRFFPIDIQDESLFDQSMEDSIGTVLAELSSSGVRPLPQPSAQNTAAASSSTIPVSSPVADVAIDTPTTKGKKRKAALPITGDTPSKASKSAKNQTSIQSFFTNKAVPPKKPNDRRTSFINLPEEPMEEMPFELPEDIVAIAISTQKDPDHGAEEDRRNANDQPGSTGVAETPINAAAQQTSKASDMLSDPSSSIPTPPPTAEAAVFELPSSTVASPAKPKSPADASMPAPETPLRRVQPAPEDRPVSRESVTPLREITKPIRNYRLHGMSQGTQKGARVDLGTIRRANELVQVLHDNGGVMMDTKLIHEHRNWAFKYAGTDHPYAPASAYGMDRLVIKKTVNILLSDGRIKETIVSVPTPTGRWVKTTVLYVSDLPHDQLQTYIRQMSSNLTQSVTPSIKKSQIIPTTLPDTPFTELKKSARPSNKLAVDATPTRYTANGQVRPFSERRTALLKELKVVGQLLGWKSSRCVRIQVLHKAIIRAVSQPECGSVVSRSPRIFAFPLLCEEITAEEWFSCCLILQYNEEIEHWLRDPVNRATKTKYVPKQYRPLGGFGGSSTKAKMHTLLQILVALRIISPVTPVAKEEADFLADSDEHKGFKVEENTLSATYYVLHDMVPVYHIASLPPPLLGLLPAQNEEDVNELWVTIQKASLEMRVDAIGRIGEQTKPGLPHSANISDTLDISMDQTKLLQRPKRWKNEMNLLPIQKAALDGVFDRTTGQSSINTQEEMEHFAYENALPLPFIETEIRRRADVAKYNAARIAERVREHALKAQERQQKIQEKIRQQLMERQELAKKTWEEKVLNSSRRKSVEYNLDLLTFVSQQTIQIGTMKMLEVTDNVIDYWVMMYDQTKDLSPQERDSVLADRRRLQAERVRLTMPKFQYGAGSKRTSTRKAKNPKTGPQKRTRSKRKWTHEDDEFMLDGEAIIRARSRVNGYKGRQAMNQIYPEMAASTLRTRLAKITCQPGKQAYYERLEDAWFDLWIKLRGTEELVDDHQDSTTEFDLKDHIRVLREKIDKKPLRLLAMSTPAEEKVPTPDLLLDSYEITEEYGWRYVATDQHTFDQIADSLQAEEIRLNSAASVSLLAEKELNAEVEIENKEMGMLQSAMKIIVGTSDEIYDVTRGQTLLDNWSSESYSAAIEEMLERNVLKRIPNPSRDNERQYGFSQRWEQVHDGFLPPDLTQHAQALIPKLEPEEGIEWPLIGESGELAALMNMVSNHEVDFGFDVNEFPSVKYEKDHFSTRKLDDDAYEFPIHVRRLSPISQPKSRVSIPAVTSFKPLIKWPTEIASKFDNQRTVKKVIEAVTASAVEGITKPELIDAIGCEQETLKSALAALAEEEKHRVFWTGYDTARLVLTDYWESWSIKLRPRRVDNNEQQLDDIRINPRRWYNLYGEWNCEDYKKSIESVKSLIILRPGINLKILRERFNVLLDRLELFEILEQLVEDQKIEIKWSSPKDSNDDVVYPFETIDINEEEDVAIFPTQRKIWT
ncbi:uncharacterized protein L201_002870 [Kwoniella dendrophila CBS 6074]|uniref:Uncharacterized protein n=1 Tax=Kwoniella dendrophila CBS 6074 TaxID=1295534 RepID=A0AAX4JSU7_9TREE